MPPLIGVNVPWFGEGYGHDLGRNPSYAEWPAYFDLARARSLLAALAARGVRLVRIWLFEDGEGVELDAEGYVTGVEATFVQNLRDLAELLRELRFRVYWVLLDANSVRRRDDAVTRSVLSEPKATSRFCECVLAEVLPGVADLAWAVDLCNEPEAMLSDDTGWADLQPALLELRRATSRALPGVPISVGSGYREHRNIAAGVYDALGLDLDFLDFHSHGADGDPPAARAVAGGRPVVIGELGIPPVDAGPDMREAWLAGQRRLLRTLRGVLAHRYLAVFLWYASDVQDADPDALVLRGEVGLVLDSLSDLVSSPA
jgi:hypothetical protein